MRALLPFFVLLVVLVSMTTNASSTQLSGKVSIDGSSTVFPITEAVAEEYRSVGPRVRVNIGVSGTGGGFKKFTKGEIDINNASRRIKQKEIDKAKKASIKFLELPVAYDGLTVVINKKNTWAKKMTVSQLKKIWDRGSKVKLWSDVDPSWPKKEIKLYGPGTDSGTFDYFTKAINGKSGRCRADFTKSEDDNVLVNGVAGDTTSLGFFGFAYYLENKNKIDAVQIDGVSPSPKTINDGSYKPLSRPIYIYVRTDSLKRPEVASFVNFYMNSAKELVSDVGYIPLKDETYAKNLKEIKGHL